MYRPRRNDRHAPDTSHYAPDSRLKVTQYPRRFFESAPKRLCDVVGADQPLDIGSPERGTGDGTKLLGQFFVRQLSLSVDSVQAVVMAARPRLDHFREDEVNKAMKPTLISWIRRMAGARWSESGATPDLGDRSDVIHHQPIDLRVQL